MVSRKPRAIQIIKMNAALPLLYTNEVSPEFLHTLDKSPFADQVAHSVDLCRGRYFNLSCETSGKAKALADLAQVDMLSNFNEMRDL